MSEDRRLIEDFIPIREIGKEASREKCLAHGKLTAIQHWWAARPISACRPAIYATMVPVETNDTRDFSKILEKLSKFECEPTVIARARKDVLDAHSKRLSNELGRAVTLADIEEGRVPSPRILDIFAGSGAIPLEASRLGCESYALELNPVAHLAELCVLVYPQKYGRPDTKIRGSGENGAWRGLASEVEHWGRWVIEHAKKEIQFLYPPIPLKAESNKTENFNTSEAINAKELLTPAAYLWTRLVRCKSPTCNGPVPLLRQTWLCRKKKKYIAFRVDADKQSKKLRFKVVSSSAKDEEIAKKELGFDPSKFSTAGNAICPFCGTVADSDYVKTEGRAGRIGLEPMVVVCTHKGHQGKIYISADELGSLLSPSKDSIQEQNNRILEQTGLSLPLEPIINDGKEALFCVLYGLDNWADLFTLRQIAMLMTFVKYVRLAQAELQRKQVERDRLIAISTYLAFLVSRLSSWNNTLCTWYSQGEKIEPPLGRNDLPMVWDFAESNPLSGASGDSEKSLLRSVEVLRKLVNVGRPSIVLRGSATELPFEHSYFDAIITDPPYYDNVPYADLSDQFYVWLKRAIGDLYPEHFAGELTPKRAEIVADASRHSGDKDKARQFYESKMREALAQAYRVLKPSAPLMMIYAHKTTVGWTTIINALREVGRDEKGRSFGFQITAAWPISTERPGRLREQQSAALASSIFLIARRREGGGVGKYETYVRPMLENIVRERVDSLWKEGISGADLVIATVGTGLSAYTRFERIEYENGEEVPAERFLQDVEGLVLDVILERLRLPRSGVGAAVDPPTRFYVLWRYTYGQGFINAGEAIVFAYTQNVELDGPMGLSTGIHALLKKEKGKYRLRDYIERGKEEQLGLVSATDERRRVIDVLHRTLWLMENQPGKLSEFLEKARPSREQLRLVAQALGGPALKGGQRNQMGGPSTERTAIEKLLTHWRTLVEENVYLEKEKQLTLDESMNKEDYS